MIRKPACQVKLIQIGDTPGMDAWISYARILLEGWLYMEIQVFEAKVLRARLQNGKLQEIILNVRPKKGRGLYINYYRTSRL